MSLQRTPMTTGQAPAWTRVWYGSLLPSPQQRITLRDGNELFEFYTRQTISVLAIEAIHMDTGTVGYAYCKRDFQVFV